MNVRYVEKGIPKPLAIVWSNQLFSHRLWRFSQEFAKFGQPLQRVSEKNLVSVRGATVVKPEKNSTYQVNVATSIIASVLRYSSYGSKGSKGSKVQGL